MFESNPWILHGTPQAVEALPIDADNIGSQLTHTPSSEPPPQASSDEGTDCLQIESLGCALSLLQISEYFLASRRWLNAQCY